MELHFRVYPSTGELERKIQIFSTVKSCSTSFLPSSDYSTAVYIQYPWYIFVTSMILVLYMLRYFPIPTLGSAQKNINIDLEKLFFEIYKKKYKPKNPLR